LSNAGCPIERVAQLRLSAGLIHIKIAIVYGAALLPLIDRLIVGVAIESGAHLPHNNRDFDRIDKVAPKLKIANR
jgi:predicted nucleic acid-binding protein